MFHAEPICTVEESLYKFKGATYFSELDLTKAYYQVQIAKSAKPLTVFPTHPGLMEFYRLPIGLVNAGAIYVRLRRQVLLGWLMCLLQYLRLWKVVGRTSRSTNYKFDKVESLLKISPPISRKT